MRDENVHHPSRPLAPAWALLNSQHLKLLDSIILKEKNNNIEMKYGTIFYGCHTALDTCGCNV
jgi:hypothetical protein